MNGCESIELSLVCYRLKQLSLGVWRETNLNLGIAKWIPNPLAHKTQDFLPWWTAVHLGGLRSRGRKTKLNSNGRIANIQHMRIMILKNYMAKTKIKTKTQIKTYSEDFICRAAGSPARSLVCCCSGIKRNKANCLCQWEIEFFTLLPLPTPNPTVQLVIQLQRPI